MKMIPEGTINVLGVKYLVLWNSADLFHMEKHLHRKHSVNCKLHGAACNIYPGQEQLTHTWHPRVDGFLWMNKNCTAHKKSHQNQHLSA